MPGTIWDPVGIAKYKALAEDSIMVVEPMALDGLENNITNNPGSSMFWIWYINLCTCIKSTASRSWTIKLDLKMELLSSAGFSNVELVEKQLLILYFK